MSEDNNNIETTVVTFVNGSFSEEHSFEFKMEAEAFIQGFENANSIFSGDAFAMKLLYLIEDDNYIKERTEYKKIKELNNE